jgi:excisionase family DNA binding protein
MRKREELSAWLSKRETAASLGMSERTLDRLVQSGRGPELRQRQRPGRRPEPVYRPEDVERLAAAGAAVAIAPASAIGPREVAISRQSRHGGGSGGDIVGIVEQLAALARPAAPRPWLTIAEASEYSGLSVALLRRLVRSGQLQAIRDGAVKVRRVDIDNLADNLATVAGLATLKP